MNNISLEKLVKGNLYTVEYTSYIRNKKNFREIPFYLDQRNSSDFDNKDIVAGVLTEKYPFMILDIQSEKHSKDIKILFAPNGIIFVGWIRNVDIVGNITFQQFETQQADGFDFKSFYQKCEAYNRMEKIAAI